MTNRERAELAGYVIEDFADAGYTRVEDSPNGFNEDWQTILGDFVCDLRHFIRLWNEEHPEERISWGQVLGSADFHYDEERHEPWDEEGNGETNTS